MSKIHVMSEVLANKIAAGEVIERVSSVVKELVENSIDAKSKSIKIDLVNAGIKSLTVTDDGVGMESDDALLAFSRHATSKLLKDDDLFFINTLGFRGEALPSIASVSKVILKTSTGNAGTLIEIHGGKLIKEEKNENIKNVKITLDGEEKINTDVNSTTYTTEVKLQDNASNVIVVEASNGNLTSTIKRQRPLPIN